MTADIDKPEGYLAALVNRAPVGICLVDAGLRILEINAAALRVFGDAIAGKGQRLEEIVRARWERADADDVVRMFQRVFATGDPYIAKQRNTRAIGSDTVECYEWRLEPISLSDDRKAVACYLQEVSDRAQAEHSAQRLAAIVEFSDDAIVSKDLNGIVMSWNKGAERLFGYAPDEIIGKHISILIPPERLDEEPGIIDRIRRGERFDHYETIRRRKDGNLINISLSVSPLRDANGEVIGASKIARDISQRKQADATQQLLLNELNHRVKNTLATVQAIAQQTLRRTKDPAKFAEQFSGRIQSLARVHSQLTEATWQGADLKQLIHDQLVRGAVDEARLTMLGPDVRLGPQMATHLALMIHELGTNAVKYGALSNEEGRIVIEWSLREDTLHIQWIERGGPPVAAPGAQGFGSILIEQSSKSAGGQAHRVYKAEGVAWDLRLPLSQADRSRLHDVQRTLAARPKPFALPTQPDVALSGRRLLVIEDEPLIALEMSGYLERAGAETVRQAGAEEEALSAIAESEFDGALLDANLQGQPVDRIASALTRRGVPFLFVTGYGRGGLPASFQHAPILSKPVSERELIAAVAGNLARSCGETGHRAKVD